MKKILTALLALMLLTACASQSEPGETNESTIASETSIIEETKSVFSTDKGKAADDADNSDEKIGDSMSSPFIKSEYSCTSDRRTAYAKYLYENLGVSKEFPYGIYIGDVNKDGNDEMVIAHNPFGQCEIVYYGDDGLKTVALNVWSMWGNSWYNAETGEFINRSFYGHTTGTFGADDIHIYSWDGENYVETYSYERKAGYSGYDEDGAVVENYGAAFINGKEVTNEKFEKEQDKIHELILSLGNNSIDYVYNPDYPMPEYIPEEADTDIGGYLEEKLYI